MVNDRDCESCIHKVNGACNVWECKFEPKFGTWIPVSERLPEERQSVLVWCPEYRNMYCAYLEHKNWWIFGAFSRIIPNEVKAWMPLPEPYRAERR